MTWLDLTDPSSGQIEAAASSAQAVLLIGALLYTRRQLKLASEAREAVERPFVVVELDPMRVPSISHIVVTNFGRSIARNVTFEFEPPLDNARGEEPSSVLTEGIPSLAPGREIACVHDSFIERESKADLAERHVVKVRYEGERLRSGRPRVYTDSMVLDLGQWAQHHYIDRKTVHELAVEMKKVREELHKWTSGIHGLHVRTDADLRRDAEQMMDRHRQHLAEREGQGPRDGPASQPPG